ncbi:MAG: amidohydrolase family protein [Acidimicrobiales bacterium]|nr:amidohydrolase family protein [Acidimicrobiales bacterium]MCB9393946.1 amidohydrolase family protein [Acidimicrobiaceae bacterium]
MNDVPIGTEVDVDAVLGYLTPERGWLVLPAFAEPHAHLDKAFLAERVDNPTGDLMGAIEAMVAYSPHITFDDIVERAERAALLMLANGTTAIRTHADLMADKGLRNVEALLTVRDRLAHLVDIEVVVLCGWPSCGEVGKVHRDLLREALAMGADLAGGCPHLEDDGVEATDLFLEIAAEAGRPIDLHTDETLDPAKLFLDHLSTRVVEMGFEHAVTASHCCSLAMQPDDVQRRVADQVASAGIHVVALPHTNLFLQGRDHQQAMPRGLTAVKALRAAGANVAAGADNLQDPFNPVGRGDPLETAGLMIMAAHLLPHEALASISDAPRRMMGLAPADPAAGDLVAVRATTVRDAIAFGPAERIVLRRGRLVAGELPAGALAGASTRPGQS